MEQGIIEREIFIEATPEVVFEVVSSPEHLKGWWPDDADYEARPGSEGTITFGDCSAGGKVVQFAVVDARPPRTFSFRWTHPAGEPPTAGNSLLVTFELTPSGGGTLLRMTETGFRERGWSQAIAEQEYREHVHGWGIFLPRLAPYVATLQVQP
ncbi:activator of HSP90 ATPase [Actinoplanes sp. SE50]|uniref:SRPBCC family protein n=1 Tax=unclassified Actinoplanes TaxID=2626549 RepID=UPI00023EC79B|nr:MULTISPECIES: SRPBCC family protein [unclassified Actinoplanes]AEV83685.1 activator of HSP90 ATPase 1 family protein [Actinoplanes sp. SE50/110]ATO82171.1 activator of HSP90 ATPase [Actinoplanes sp. SE50]SLL99578.1 activator of HSP90 ATPase [Actinoplanes sp. SE50/110]